jgi:transcriptional regulator with XRE-family HTH domain
MGGAVSPAVRKPLNRDLGGIVRRLRREQNMSVRKLAAAVDFSASFISQLERNMVSPSISSLERLASGLGVTLGDFFKDTSSEAVIRRTGRQTLTSGWSRARIEALNRIHPGQHLESIIVTIGPGGTSGKRAHPYDRERFVIIFAGVVRLSLNESTFTLHRGDSVMVLPGVPVHWENRGKRPASLVIVSSRL